MNETIKHNFNGPFIPLAILHETPKKQVSKKAYLVCKRDKKPLQKFNIGKGQIIEIELSFGNMITFYDKTIKQNRHISLPRKLMKHFKELD